MSGPDLDGYRVAPGSRVDLGAHDPRGTGPFGKGGKERAKAETAENFGALDALQERLYAEGERSLLVVLQAMDAGGKDSTIRRVFGPLNPQGVRVTGFKRPTERERAHDFLWRVHRAAPGRGEIAVFNRSHYEDVLVARVKGLAPEAVIERRYGHINAFEALLAEAGTRVVKFYLHISKDYQAERLRRRLERPDKHWKFEPQDLVERESWEAYRAAFERALSRCSTEAAPWYVVPAERRWYRDWLVSAVLRRTLEAMGPQYPSPRFDPAAFPPDAVV